MMVAAQLSGIGLLFFVTGGQSFEDLLRRGMQLVEAKRWEEAEVVLRQAAEADPLAADPHVELGRLYLHVKRGEAALIEIDRALALRRGEFELLFLRGLALIELEKFDFAALELAAALAKRPDDVACRKALGSARFRAGELEEALEALKPLMEGGAADGSVHAVYGSSLLLLGRYEEAAASFVQALTSSSADDTEIVLGLVEAELRLGRHADARRRLNPLLASHASLGRVWFLQALLEESEKQYAAAVVSFRRAIELGHDAAEAHLELGVCLAHTGQREAAWSAFDLALSTKPRLARAFYYKGILLSEAGKPAEAAELFEHAAALDPEDSSASIALADVYLVLKQYDRAVEAAELAAREPAQAGRAFYLMAMAYHQTNQLAQAKLAYQEAIARGADSAEVYLNFGKLLIAMSELTEARDALGEALERDRNLAGAHLEMGIVDTQLSHLDAALAHIESALEISPSMAEAWYRKGVVHSRRGESARAVESWRKALALDPETTHVYYRLGTELVKLGQMEEGEKLLHEFKDRSMRDEIRDQRSARLENVLMQALILSKERRDEEALQYFQQALEIDPESSLTYPALGEFHLLRGRAAEAETVLHQGLAIHPESIPMRELLLLVYQTTGNREGAEVETKRLEELKTKR